jgi:hypothetical protein
MKLPSQIVLAIVAAASCAAAGAQTYSSDQERRLRNREEAIARHERMGDRTADRSSVRAESRDAAQTVKEKTRHAAQKTKSFTHRTLEKVRNFGERQQRKLPARDATPETDKNPQALGK